MSTKADVEVEVKVEWSTDKALLVSTEKTAKVWIPKSQISDFTGDDIDKTTSIFIPEWLAIAKGLV